MNIIHMPWDVIFMIGLWIGLYLIIIGIIMFADYLPDETDKIVEINNSKSEEIKIINEKKVTIKENEEKET